MPAKTEPLLLPCFQLKCPVFKKALLLVHQELTISTMKISIASLALLFAASEAFQVGPVGRASTSLNILAGTER